jgi:hypothetical protein
MLALVMTTFVLCALFVLKPHVLRLLQAPPPPPPPQASTLPSSASSSSSSSSPLITTVSAVGGGGGGNPHRIAALQEHAPPPAALQELQRISAEAATQRRAIARLAASLQRTLVDAQQMATRQQEEQDELTAGNANEDEKEAESAAAAAASEAPTKRRLKVALVFDGFNPDNKKVFGEGYMLRSAAAALQHLDTTRGLVQFSFFSELGAADAFLAQHSAEPFDIVVGTDVWPDGRLVDVAQHTPCRMRVLDFWCKPTSEHFSRVLRMDSMQVWTPYPTSSCQHMGLVIAPLASPSSNATSANSDDVQEAATVLLSSSSPPVLPHKQRYGLVWGKELKYFRESVALLNRLAQHVPLHTTITRSECTQLGLDTQRIQCRGLLSEDAFVALMRDASFFLGIQHPLIGPSALEAVALGTPFINPVYAGAGLKAFHNMPRYASQHPYAATLAEPCVYTIDIRNEALLHATVARALQRVCVAARHAPALDALFRVESIAERLWQNMHEPFIALDGTKCNQQ